MVVVAYLGWIAYGAMAILPQHLLVPLSSQEVVNIVSALTLLAFWSLFTLERSPWTFYLYFIFPVYFWRQVFLTSGSTILSFLNLRKIPSTIYLKLLQYPALILASFHSIFLSIQSEWWSFLIDDYSIQLAYTHRSIWSVGFVVIGVAWPLLSWPDDVREKEWDFFLCWSASCLITAIFPLLSVDKKESILAM